MPQCTVQFIKGARQGQIDTLEGERFTCGRGTSCLVKFDPEADAEASTEHAQLFFGDDGKLLVVDLRSTNGTFVNGARIQPGVPVPVEPGAMVGFGERGPLVRVHYHEKTAPPKPGRTRVMMADLAQKLDAERGEAAKKQKHLVIALVSVVALALLITLIVLLALPNQAQKEAESNARLVEEAKERALKARAADYAPESLRYADELRAEAVIAYDGGSYVVARDRYDEARRAYLDVEREAEAKERDEQARELARKERAERERIEKERDDKIRTELEKLKGTGGGGPPLGGGGAVETAEERKKREEAEEKVKKLEALLKAPGEIAAQYGFSVCSIRAEAYVKPKTGKARRLLVTAEGTGFATSSGQILAPKHVVECWKYDPIALALAKLNKEEKGLDTKVDLVVVFGEGGPKLSTADGTLAVAKVAQDVLLEERSVAVEWNPGPTKEPVNVRPHAPEAGNWALLDSKGPRPLTPVKIAPVPALKPGESEAVIVGPDRTASRATVVGFDGQDVIILGTPPTSTWRGAPVFDLEKREVYALVVGGEGNRTRALRIAVALGSR